VPDEHHGRKCVGDGAQRLEQGVGGRFVEIFFDLNVRVIERAADELEGLACAPRWRAKDQIRLDMGSPEVYGDVSCVALSARR
jgi:hypothetical protein